MTDQPARTAVYSALMWPEWNPTSESYGVGEEKANALLDAHAAEVRGAEQPTPVERRRTTWPAAVELQQAADIRRAAGDPLLADWLDETANALAWLAPYRDNEPGYGMWETAVAVARKILGTTDEATAEHHVVDGARYLCHADDHYCPNGPHTPADAIDWKAKYEAEHARHVAVVRQLVADPSAVLRGAADEIDRETQRLKDDGVLEPDNFRPCRDATADLRRMADEAQQPAPAVTEVKTDTLAHWLYQRFTADLTAPLWDGLTDDGQSYWEHEAAAVRRAVVRNGFKTPAEPDAEGLCGKTIGMGLPGHPYRPCARPAGHSEAYCRDASGEHYFLAATPTP